MTNVGAYTEVRPGFEEPDWAQWTEIQRGSLISKGSWGLEVNWGADKVPETAQVYLVWEPRVYAVWNTEVEDGEAGESGIGGGSGDEATY